MRNNVNNWIVENPILELNRYKSWWYRSVVGGSLGVNWRTILQGRIIDAEVLCVGDCGIHKVAVDQPCQLVPHEARGRIWDSIWSVDSGRHC